jgi:hypothetical protein
MSTTISLTSVILSRFAAASDGDRLAMAASSFRMRSSQLSIALIRFSMASYSVLGCTGPAEDDPLGCCWVSLASPTAVKKVNSCASASL